MSPQQLNKCRQKFYVSTRKQDGNFYIKTESLIAIRAALDRNLRSPPLNKPFSIIGEPDLTYCSACVLYAKTIIHLSVGKNDHGEQMSSAVGSEFDMHRCYFHKVGFSN